MSTKIEILKQGAEGKLYLSEYNGKQCLVKERFVKNYRHPDLDKSLTKERIRTEVKSLGRCRAVGIATPEIYHSDLQERKIYMEYFPTAITAKDYINQGILQGNDQEDKLNTLAERFGRIIGKLHSNNIIHGDLTTSNVLVKPHEGSATDDYDLIIIDFGLSQYQASPEAKGVDLYVLERALLSTHSTIPKLFDKILNAYSEENASGKDGVITKFEDVRARGRKRTMIG